MARLKGGKLLGLSREVIWSMQGEHLIVRIQADTICCHLLREVMKTQFLHSPQVAVSPGGYSQSVELSEFNRLLFISGQVPATKEGEVPSSFEQQAALVWENLIHQLEAADMTLKNLVKVTIGEITRQQKPSSLHAFLMSHGCLR